MRHQSAGCTGVNVAVSRDHIRNAFLRALNSAPGRRGNFLEDLRATVREALVTAMADAGVTAAPWEVRPTLSRSRAVDSGAPISQRPSHSHPIDAAFCAGYGIDAYSAHAINSSRGYRALPSLRAFLDIDGFGVGNIVVALPPGSNEVRFAPSKPMGVTGHLVDPRKRKPYVAALGVHFESAGLRCLLGDDISGVAHTSCDVAWLDEIVVEVLRFPILYICRYCGRLHTCECFRAHVDPAEIRRQVGGRPEILERMESLGFVAGLCHLCRGGVPRHSYGHPMYYSSFGRRYRPYIELFVRRAGDGMDTRHRVAENAVRSHFGFPAIGERWTSETVLLRVVEGLVAPRQVVHHYRGKELEGLELDVWIPELKVGIEYQGEQHYQPIKHWGGEEGLAKRRSYDRRKRELCKQLGYTLIEFRFDEELTEAVVQSRLQRHIASDAR